MRRCQVCRVEIAPPHVWCEVCTSLEEIEHAAKVRRFLSLPSTNRPPTKIHLPFTFGGSHE